jgi:glutaredoxin 3
MASTVVMYSKSNCNYCNQAKQLLDRKNVMVTEKKIDEHPEWLEEMLALSGGRRTVPQIFINDKHVGGSDDLYALEREGKLDSLLKS